MRPHVMVLAYMMLAAPPGTPEPPYAHNDELADALRVAAVASEIMSAAETPLYFNDPTKFQAQLDAIRTRRLLTDGAPPLVELDRLPCVERCAEVLRFNEEYRRQLTIRCYAEPERADVLLRARAEAAECYRVWEVVRDAAWDQYSPAHRRQCMRRLRDMLGAAYDGPIHPPIAPEWAFEPRR